MNAPVFRPANDRAAGDRPAPDGSMLRGLARHVSRDGCQFVIAGKVPGIGQKLRLCLPSGSAVSGTIQWVLGERIGFAFDMRISSSALAELSSPLAEPMSIEVLNAASHLATK